MVTFCTLERINFGYAMKRNVFGIAKTCILFKITLTLKAMKCLVLDIPFFVEDNGKIK